MADIFKKILIANRGEIARRIILACRELGISPVVIYSEPDAAMPWVRMADESYPLKGAAAAETYLNQEAIFHAARLVGVDAVHPGYGFLSENAAFAAACAEHDLVFIGPKPKVIELLGSKARARELAHKCGVPVIPGLDTSGISDSDLAVAVQDIGYPLLIKASAGGGGKGIRIVSSAAEFFDALHLARSEANASFGNDHILLERYLIETHHVEIQVLGDQHGTLLHLYERECSVQRRHQKIIEESPSPAISDEIRARMAAAAVNLASAAGYENAGTVEFVVNGSGDFYFLEMNTRLQVEHPVTEMITGVDLAAWQIRIAAGEPLPYAQNDIPRRGHALECRVYAEDPALDFLPSIGTVTTYRSPSGPGVRVEEGVEKGSEVSPYYDPMLAKVITWGQDRPEAVRKMERALRDMIVLGVKTNIPYLLAILGETQFLAGYTTTNYLNKNMAGWVPQEHLDEDMLLAAAVFEILVGSAKSSSKVGGPLDTAKSQADPWNDLHSWRNVKTD